MAIYFWDEMTLLYKELRRPIGGTQVDFYFFLDVREWQMRRKQLEIHQRIWSANLIYIRRLW